MVSITKLVGRVLYDVEIDEIDLVLQDGNGKKAGVLCQSGH